MRLSKAARELKIFISSIVAALELYGFKIDPNPKTKLTPEQFECLLTHFDIKRQKDNISDKEESSTDAATPKNLNESLIGNENNENQEVKYDIIINNLIQQKKWTVGQVTYFNKDRGFGFIECLEIDREVFIHISKILTKPIKEKDFVVFKIETSKTNKGSYVALELYLLSKFKNEPQFLHELYNKFAKEDFRTEVLKSLSINSFIGILDEELSKFKQVKTDNDYCLLKEIIKLFNKGIDNEELRLLFYNQIVRFVNENCLPTYRIKLWLDGILDIIPKRDILINFFLASQDNIRLEVFQKIETPFKIDLLKKIFDKNNPERLLDFIISHLCRINNNVSIRDVKSFLFDKKYWENKKDYTLYLETIDYLNINLETIQIIKLFIEGFIDKISIEAVIKNIDYLIREDIKKILESQFITKIEAFKIIRASAEKEINKFKSEGNIPDKCSVHNDTDEEWKKYYEKQAEPFCWLLTIAKELLTDNKFGIVENLILTKTTNWIQLILWEKRLSYIFPEQAIVDYLLSQTDVQIKIEGWLANGFMSKEKVITILLLNLKSLKEVQNRHNFYTLLNHLKALNKFDIDIKNTETPVIENNIGFFKLALWIEDISSEFNYEEFRTKIPFLSPEHQIRFLRKIFKLKHEKKFDLTVEKLAKLINIDFDIFKINEEYNPEIPLDISVDIVIEAIKSFSESGKFLLDSDLLKIVLKDVSNDKKHKFQVAELFEKCEGRFEAKYNWITKGEINKIPFGDGQFYFAIQFEAGEMREVWGKHRGVYQHFVPSPYFEALKDKVKRLPGRKWNPEKQHWGVPSRYENEVLNFAQENQFFLNVEGSKYVNNKHLAAFKRTETPNGIIYCEGRQSNIKDKIFNRDFWWCCNHPCYDNCETLHTSEEWNRYTLLDFLTILGLSLDDSNRVGDSIERGKYYQFISEINRFNRLLERMYCKVCDNILYPIEDSNFAHYRVSRFSCTNEKCSEYRKEIYLHHCLNGKCNGIIDSRKSEQCPNGLYICDNKECGCCCSHEMLKRRLENLKVTGGYIHQNLETLVNNLSGHLERAMHYCFKCGALMIEMPNDVFRCNRCDIQYDVSKNMFKRPHRHLVKGTLPQSGNIFS